LTLTVGDDLSAALVDRVGDSDAPQDAIALPDVDMSVSIAPNLVPAGSFPVAKVNLVLGGG
jgi:hypothetical protein